MADNMTELSSFESLLDDTPDVGTSSDEINWNERIDANSLLDDEPDEPDVEDSTTESAETPDYSDNALYSFLQEKGITDPSKIKFEGENGEIEERSFEDLSSDEQKEILNSLTEDKGNGLSDYENSVINYLRDNNVTLDQVIDYFSSKKVDEYIAQNTPAPSYAVDDYTDEELYLANLKELHPSFTDDELVDRLEASKKNEELFNKEVTELRQQYKDLEEKNMQEAAQREQQQYADLQNNLIKAAADLTEVMFDPDDPESDSIVIEDAEREKALAYLFEQGADGKSQLIKDLENPDALIELAWLRTQGAELLAGTSRYWKNELKQARAENKRLQAQLDKVNKRNDTSTVVPEKPKTQASKNLGSVWDRSSLI